jgi:hypothetical protein
MSDRIDKGLWRIEANDPRVYTEWRPLLWEFEEHELPTFESLIDELSSINAPVQFRIVRNPGKASA